MNIFDVRENLDTIVFDHDQQIKDLAAQLLELKQSTAMFNPGMSVTQGDVTPMMEFKRREWVGLTDREFQPMIQKAMAYYGYDQSEPSHLTAGAGFRVFAYAIEAKLREKNGG